MMPVAILPRVNEAASFPTAFVSRVLLLNTYSLLTINANATPMTQDAALLMVGAIPKRTSAA